MDQLIKSAPSDETGSEGIPAGDVMDFPDLPARKKMFFQRAAFFFMHPLLFFQQQKEQPDFVFPLLTSIAATAICMFFSLPKLTSMLKESMPMELPPEQMESMIKIQSIAAVATTPLAILATVLITAILFHYLSRMLGGLGKIKGALAIVSYTGLIGTIAMILRTGMLLVIPGASYDQVLTSLAVLLPASSGKTTTYLLLANFDFFTLWSLAVTAIGFKILYDIPGKRSWLMVFGCWAVYVAAAVGIGAAFMPQL